MKFKFFVSKEISDSPVLYSQLEKEIGIIEECNFAESKNANNAFIRVSFNKEEKGLENLFSYHIKFRYNKNFVGKTKVYSSRVFRNINLRKRKY